MAVDPRVGAEDELDRPQRSLIFGEIVSYNVTQEPGKFGTPQVRYEMEIQPLRGEFLYTINILDWTDQWKAPGATGQSFRKLGLLNPSIPMEDFVGKYVRGERVSMVGKTKKPERAYYEDPTTGEKKVRNTIVLLELFETREACQAAADEIFKRRDDGDDEDGDDEEENGDETPTAAPPAMAKAVDDPFAALAPKKAKAAPATAPAPKKAAAPPAVAAPTIPLATVIRRFWAGAGEDVETFTGMFDNQARIKNMPRAEMLEFFHDVVAALGEESFKQLLNTSAVIKAHSFAENELFDSGSLIPF